MYVVGRSQHLDQIDLDPSAGVTTLGSYAYMTCYIAKYSAAGALVWAKALDRATIDRSVFDADGFVYNVNGLDIDRQGNITVIGQRSLIVQKRPYNIDYLDAVVLHLDNNGNMLWEKLIESGSKAITPEPYQPYVDIQTGYKVASDDAGNLIAVFGFAGSPDVDGKVSAKGNADGLVVKYDTKGNVIWKFSLGATGFYSNTVLEAAVDKDNNIIIAGYTTGTVNYNPLGTPVNITEDHAMFLARYSPAGILQWVKIIDGKVPDYHVRLALDGQDNIYISGAVKNPNSIDLGVAPTITPTSSTEIDIFIAKYSPGGDLLYHKSIGGTSAAMINSGMVTGPDNSLYLTGNFTGKVDLDPSSAVAQLDAKDGEDMFLAKYDENGNYQWAFGVPGFYRDSNAGAIYLDLNYLNNYVDDWPHGGPYLYVNSGNEIFMTGAFQSTVNFDGTGCGVSNLKAQSDHTGADMFIVRYMPTTEVPITNNELDVPALPAICPGDVPGRITGHIPVGGLYSYQWQLSLDNITFTDIPGAVAKDLDPPTITATTYYRRRLVTSACEVPNIINAVKLAFSTPVSATDNTITAPSIIGFCNAGDAGLIRGPAPQGDITYKWQRSTDNVTFTDISGATAKEYDPPPADVTTYYRRLVTNAPCSIDMPSNTVTITVSRSQEATVSAEQTVCSGDAVTLNATGGSRYSWSPAAGLSSADSASPVASPNITTTYSVTIYNGACNTTLPVKVNVVSQPTVDAGPDKDITSGDKVQLNGQISAAEGATYSWAPTTYLDDPNIANPTAAPLKNITYRLTVTSPKSCFVASDEVTINVHEKMIVPNTFTPNGDGVNDILTIDGLDSYKQSLLTIFDRYGQQVFKSLAYPKPWDGTRNGKPIPIGTYYYVIDLKNGSKVSSGWVSIIK